MKISRLVPAILCLAAAIPGAAAMDLDGLGVRTAMEVTIPSGGHNIYDNGAGFTVGAVYDIPIYRAWSFEPGAMFFYNTMTCRNPTQIGDYFYDGAPRNMGIRLPLMMQYSYTIAPGMDLTFGTGPWLNFSFYARQTIQPNLSAPVAVPDKRINLFNFGWKHFDAQWGFRLSMTFASSYYVGITDGVAFTPLASYGMKDKRIRVHRNTIALSLGYNF